MGAKSESKHSGRIIVLKGDGPSGGLRLVLGGVLFLGLSLNIATGLRGSAAPLNVSICIADSTASKTSGETRFLA